jgi:two-component system chemotaxis sensor kinase CheA
VAVVQAGTAVFGLLVDRVTEAREATVMALPPLLAGIGLYAGGMELAGGSVALVLDPLGLAAAAGIEATVDRGPDTRAEARGAASANLVDLLVLRDAGGPAIAVPLALVDRVEDIDGRDISCSGGETRALTRGAGIPLLDAGGAWATPRQGRQRIVVCGEGERAVALLAGRMLDLVEAGICLSDRENRPASFGTVEIEGASVEVIDPNLYLEGRREATSASGAIASAFEDDVRRVLLVDDNPFFRQFLPPLLGSAGYRVTAVDSVEHALELCEAGEVFDAILTDVDLPAGQKGDFTETVKASDTWRKTPLVGLSSDPGRDQGHKDRAPSFAGTVGKFDRAKLLRVLRDTLTHERGAA